MKVKELKKFIFENSKVEYILEELNFHNIKNNGKYISCAFPDGDNPNGCIIYLCDNLNVSSYTRDINSTFNTVDFIDLVHFALNNNKINDTLNYLLNILGLDNKIEYKNNKENRQTILDEILKLNLKQKTKNNIDKIYYSLDEYLDKYHINLLYEGIGDIDTLKLFQIKLDIISGRIVFPHFNINGDCIGVVGRTTNPLYKELKIQKYLVLKGKDTFKKSHNLYGLYQTKKYIQEKKEVIIFEAEKSVLKAYQYGFKNCVALGNHSISNEQIKILLSLKIETIYIAFDKDIKMNYISKEIQKLKLYFNVNIIYDENFNLLDEKDSPIDKGYKVFYFLYKVAKKI